MDTTSAAAVTAAKVSDAMRTRGVSQKSMAESTGIPRVTLIRRLNGTNPFTVTELAAVAATLDVDVRDLVPGGDAHEASA